MSDAKKKPGFTLLTGRTYPVRDKLGRMPGGLGGIYDPILKAWWMPDATIEKARALVAGVNGSREAAPKVNVAGRKPRDFSSFRPTPEQASIAEVVMTTADNVFVEAAAGSGKTTTALWIVYLMLERSKGALDVVFVTFSLASKNDVLEKAPDGVEVLTFNGLGHQALMRAWSKKVDFDKEHIWTVFRQHVSEKVLRERSAFFASTATLIERGKGALAETEEDLAILVGEFDLPLENGEVLEAVALAHKIMSAQRADRSQRTIDYSDQLWLPIVHNMRLPEWDVIMVDESQDTNAVQMELIARAASNGARIIAVGDRRQCIYAFRGADKMAVETMISRFNMVRRPLMTTFRCAKAIVRKAQQIVPEYRAGEHNPEGIVDVCELEDLLTTAKPGDFIISRTNAPLIAWCIRALARNIPAAVVGRGVGPKLLGLAKKVRTRMVDPSVGAFEDAVEAWARTEIEKLEKKIPVRENLIDNVRDNADCLLALAEGARDVPEVLARIENIVKEDSSGKRLDFTTAHRSKGLERDRVFVFEDTFLLKRKDRRTGEWKAPAEDEYNLLYVAWTRAKTELYEVYGAGGARRDRGEA